MRNCEDSYRKEGGDEIDLNAAAPKAEVVEKVPLDDTQVSINILFLTVF